MPDYRRTRSGFSGFNYADAIKLSEKTEEEPEEVNTEDCGCDG